MRLNLANPSLIFIASWGFTTLLMTLDLTTNLVGLSGKATLLVLTNIVTALLVWLFMGPQADDEAPFEVSARGLQEMNALSRRLLLIWAVGSALDIVYSGGVPILWAVLGIGKDYTEFGVPSFHGVMNALYLFSVTAIAVDVIHGKAKRGKTLALLLLWPMVMLGRGILLSALLQIAAVYLLARPITLKRMFSIGLIVLANVVLFGVVGEFRGTEDTLSYLVPAEGHLLARLPSGFLWFYVYLTTGLNNLAYSIDTVRPDYVPYYSIINLLPSFLRKQSLDYQLNATAFDLVDENLNTNSFYSGYISDFGLAGGILAGLALQVIAMRFFTRARTGEVGAVLAYAVLFECVVFSVFYDMLLLLPYLLQIALALYLSRRVRLAEASAAPEGAAP